MRHCPERAVREHRDETAALTASIETAMAEIAALMEKSSGDAVDILAFQLAMLEDDALRAPAREAIAGGTPAHEAWSSAWMARSWVTSPPTTTYLPRPCGRSPRHPRPRAAASLRHRPGRGRRCCGYFGEDMPPTRFLGIDWSQGGAIALARGTAPAMSPCWRGRRGIPMVVGLGRRSCRRFPAIVDGAASFLPSIRMRHRRAPGPAPCRSCGPNRRATAPSC